MAKLDEAIIIIDERFPASWWRNYSFHLPKAEVPNWSENIQRFKADIDNAANEIFDILNLSILRGEYVEDPLQEDKCIKLKLKIEALQPKITFLDDLDEEISELLFVGELRKAFIEPIKLGLSVYQEFIARINRKIRISSKEFVIDHSNQIISALEANIIDAKFKKDLDLFGINVRVAEFDHFLNIRMDIIQYLFQYERLIEASLNIKPYATLIRRKAEFLRKKLLLRKWHERNPDEVYFIEDGEEKVIDRNTIIDSKENNAQSIFTKWLEYAMCHYELSPSWRSMISNHCDSLKQKKLAECSTLELHSLIKYYKDVDPIFPGSITFIKSIETEFSKRRKRVEIEKERFNFYAMSICWNYTANNRLSAVCESPDAAVSTAERAYDDVMTIQSESGIKNFFPQTKFLKFLLGRLKTVYDNRVAFEFLNDCRNILNKCKKIYSKYEGNVQWSKRNYNFVFQLPIEECYIKIQDGSTDRIFVASSFVLPLPKDKYLSEFDSDRTEVDKLSSSVDVFNNIEKEIRQLQELKNSVRDKEYRMLEILGIFTALISFVAASLPTFKVIDTPMEGALFMLALATSLSVFVLLLLTTFRGIGKVKEHGKLIIIGIIITSVLWGSLILLNKNSPNSQNDDTEVSASKNDADNNTNVNTINNILTYPSSDNRKSVKGKVDIQVNKTVEDSLSKTPCPCPCK